MRKRKNVVRVLVGLLLVGTLLLTLAACGPPEVRYPPAEAPPEEVTPVEAPPVEAPPEEVAPPVEAPPVGVVRPPGWSLTLDDIPEITNKAPVHVGVIAAIAPEVIIEFLDRFTAKTGVPTSCDMLTGDKMYPKINTELVARTGRYDVTNVEATCVNEWIPYHISFNELAERYEPGGFEAFMVDAAGHHPTLLRMASDKEGNIYGLPFFLYVQSRFYRKDVFEDPTEPSQYWALRSGFSFANDSA